MWQSRLHRSFLTLPSLSGELLGWGWGWVVRSTVWAITAFITAFLVTLQANAMWKRLIHGSQVLNTATPPAVAVIPPTVHDPQQLPSLFPPQALLSGAKRGGRKREGEGAVITWGSKTGCGQQRESSSDPLHSNPQSVLEQPRNSNSGAKQSSGIEKSKLLLQKRKKNHDWKKVFWRGTGMPCSETLN